MMRDPHEADDDSRKCHALAVAAAREKCVRSGAVSPAVGDPTEARWAAAGPCKPSELDTVKAEAGNG